MLTPKNEILRTDTTGVSSIATAPPPQGLAIAAPFSFRRWLHIRLLEGENPSNSVLAGCLVAGHSALLSWPGWPFPPIAHRPAFWRAPFASQPLFESNQTTNNRPRRTAVPGNWERCHCLLLPTWDTLFRGSLSIASHQPICGRKMNVCRTPDTLCMLCVHHGSNSTRMKWVDEESPSITDASSFFYNHSQKLNFRLPSPNAPSTAPSPASSRSVRVAPEEDHTLRWAAFGSGRLHPVPECQRRIVLQTVFQARVRPSGITGHAASHAPILTGSILLVGKQKTR
jgi:hypothetical protein